MRAVWLLFVSAVAAAAPFAGIDATLDGKPAHVAVDDGALKVDGAVVAQLGKFASASVDARDVPGRGATILVTVDHREAIGFEKHGAWKQVFRLPIGPANEDGDYGIAVALLPSGIHRYQTRPGLHRCDGKPALFFAEGWNGTKFVRLASVATELDPDASTIAATPGATASPPPLLFHASIASREPGAGDVASLIVPSELDDGDPATAWLDAGNAVGQFFTFDARIAAKASELVVIAASKGKPAAPTELAIVGTNRSFRVTLPALAPGAAATIELPQPIGDCVSVVIDSPGPAAIAELDVYADGERAGGGEAMLAQAIAAGVDGTQAAERALATRGPAAVTAIEAELAKATDANAKARLVHALIANTDPSAGPALANAARELRLRDSDLAALLESLGKHGQLQTLAELAATHELGEPARIAAVTAISAAPGDHAALLIPLAGNGPPGLRRAVIHALSAVSLDALIAAANAVQAAPASGDLWRAITRRGLIGSSEHAPALAAELAALPAATDYERRYRLVDGIATLGDAAALAQLATVVHAITNGAEHAALAQVAAHGLASAPRAEALPLVIELSRDPDPGVRLAALSAFVGDAWQGSDAAIDTALATALASDTWPEVRRHAAEVLGNRCARSAPARALATSVGRDPELDVRDAALVALVQCKAPGTAALLAMVWDDAKLPMPLRQRAVDLAANLGDVALGAKLVGKLASWRGAAIESADALALAQSAAYTIGRLAPPGAADALLAALADSAYPEIVAAAAAGLGLLGPACPRQALSQLRALSQNDEQQIALAAKRAMAQCGR
ncbi:MAG TPA: HEAT repeat domain-containing protein [Kofleriaceae bacterium]|nr:HEAT repeat domain-containing protein [Kofleriaceae bacterium]